MEICGGHRIPKEENSRDIDQFRAISQFSMEGKIFYSILSQQLSKFLLKNAYVHTSVHKGRISGTPGCLEHTGAVTQLLREAKKEKRDLMVLWLDLTSASGSISHKLVEETLCRQHVPSTDQSLHGRSDCYNIVSLQQQVDHTRT